MSNKLSYLILMIFLSLSSFGGTNALFFNVKDFGALGDGKNLDSKAINASPVIVLPCIQSMNINHKVI